MKENARCFRADNLSFCFLIWSHVIMISNLDSPGKCCWLPAPCLSRGSPVAVSDEQRPQGRVPPAVSATHNKQADFLTAVTASISIFYESKQNQHFELTSQS